MGVNIAVFASGSGTNAENLIQYFHKNASVKIALVLSNKEDAFVLERARKHLIPTVFFSYKDLNETDKVLVNLKEYDIDFIVLAGFLLRIPSPILNTYPNKIINIHPSLLPKYGGKGMFGDKVHEAVVAAGEVNSGITIHYINEHYDDGDIIFQVTCVISPTDTSPCVASKIHFLEYKYYPQIIEDVLLQQGFLV